MARWGMICLNCNGAKDGLRVLRVIRMNGLAMVCLAAILCFAGKTHAQEAVADPLAGAIAPKPAAAQEAAPAAPAPQTLPLEAKAGTADTSSPATTGIMPAPPAPGGTPMVDGQIPPISEDMLAISPEEQEEMAVENARDKVFKSTLKQALPLEPAEIDSVIRRYEETEKAARQPYAGKEPKAEVKVETLSLEPSAAPPVIHLAPGHVTSLTLLDASGQPWPVQDVSWGGDFEIQTPDEGGHIIRISPMGGYTVGNMSIRLVKLNTPVTFTLKTQPEEVDYRFDARLPILGPNALAPVIDNSFTATAGNGTMMTILDGVPPKGSEKLTVSGVDGRTSAYKVGDQVFVRTPLSMLSPAWSDQAASADGMRVYAIPNAPVLLLSDQGRMVRANLSVTPTAESGSGS